MMPYHPLMRIDKTALAVTAFRADSTTDVSGVGRSAGQGMAGSKEPGDGSPPELLQGCMLVLQELLNPTRAC